MSNGVEHYVCDAETNRALLGPMTGREALNWILARGDLSAQAPYVNLSRYMLAKKNVYPLTMPGQRALERDIQAAQQITAPDRLLCFLSSFSGEYKFL